MAFSITDPWDYTLGEKGVDLFGTGAGKASATAQKNIQTNIVPGFQNLGNTMRDMSQQGLSWSSGQLNPARDAANAYGQYAQQPGLQQQVFNGMQGQMQQPGNTQGILGAAQQAFSGPSNTEQYGQTAMDTLGGTNATQGLYDQYRGTMGNPTNAQTYGQGAMNMISGPSQMQQGWGGIDRQLGSQGAGERYYADQQGALSGPGQFERAAGGYAAGMTGPNASRGVLAGLQGAGSSGAALAQGDMKTTLAGGMQGQQDTMNRARGAPGAVDIGASEIGNAYRGANDVQGFAGRQLGGLEAPSLYEQQAQAAFSGSDPLLDRIASQGRAAINQESIARGNYNSGGAMTALGNYQAARDAEMYQKKLDLARGAGEMQIARLGAGQGLAAGSSGERMRQGQGLQGLADNQRTLELQERGFNVGSAQGNASLGLQGGAATDQSALGRTNASINAAGNVDQGTLAAQQAQAQTTMQGQQMANARMGLGGSLANDAQSQQQGRLGMQMQGLQGMDANTLARANSQFGIGQGMDASTLARYGMAANMGNMSDTTGLNRANSQFGIGRGMDQQTLDEYGLQGQIGNMADQNELAKMGLMLDASGNIVQRNDSLQQNNVENQYNIGNAAAGYGLGYTQLGMQGYGDANSAALNALAQSYGMPIQAAQNQHENTLGLLSLPVSYATGRR